MKPIRTVIFGLASILTFTCISATARESGGIAKVVGKMGDARYFMAGDSTPHDIKLGMILKAGVTIQTASGGGNYVDIVFNDASVGIAPTRAPSEIRHWHPRVEREGIRIFDNTILTFDKLTKTSTGADVVTDTEFELKAGSILGQVKKLTPTSKYEVKIPKGVAGIRGTVYFLSATGILRVVSGSVVVAYVAPGGTNVITQIVNVGEQFDTTTGLLTPIDENIKRFFHPIEFGSNTRDVPPTTYTAPDQRIYFVSPVVGNVTASADGGSGRSSSEFTSVTGITITEVLTPSNPATTPGTPDTQVTVESP
jgi:hypothetical protein